MSLNLNIAHNNIEITDITSNSIILNAAQTMCEDNLIFTLTGVDDWSGSTHPSANKPTNLNVTKYYTNYEMTNDYICPSCISMSGKDRAVDVGTYTATYTPVSGATWSDGTTESVTVTLLIVSDTQTAEAPYAWTIPTTGTFTNTFAQTDMFKECAGTRSSDTMAGARGQSYTYYTQNEPIA